MLQHIALMIASGALGVASPSTEIYKGSISNPWEHQLRSVHNMAMTSNDSYPQSLGCLEDQILNTTSTSPDSQKIPPDRASCSREGTERKWTLNMESCAKTAPCINTQVCLTLVELQTPDTNERRPVLNGRRMSRAFSYVYRAFTSTSPLLVVAFSLWLYFAGSLFFDSVHYALHKCSKSQSWTLRRIGYLHEVHHLYFNRRLKFNDRYRWQNMCFELPLELSCQLFGTWLGYLVVQAFSLTGPGLLSRELFTVVFDFEIIRVLVVAVLEGRDSNHVSYDDTVPKDPNGFLVGPEFHAIHHVDPSSNISSSFRVFDWLFGTAYSLRSRRIAMTGASGVFGNAMKKQLESEGVSSILELKYGADWSHNTYASYVEALVDTDIVILAHGSKNDDMMEANCDSTVTLIELFKRHRKARPGSMLLPEVWYIGSELKFRATTATSQAHADSKRAFVRHARKYYDDEELIYRHIVTTSFTSKEGNAVGRPEYVARSALWWIRRGARYVPASHTGFAFLGYFKFLYWTRGVS